MIVITDSNIILSAVYKPDGTIAEIFSAKSNIQFFAPDFVLHEISKHAFDITAKTTASRKEIKERLALILSKISLIHSSDVPTKFMTQAGKIVNEIDRDDAPFVALHFYTKHKLWTGDIKLIKGLKQKGLDICITTAQLKKSLYKKK